MDERDAILALSLVDDFGPATIKKLVEKHGSARKALEHSPKQGLERLDNELKLADKNKARIMTIIDKDYPENLKQIHSAPPVLYVKGKLLKEDAAAVAVVGARRATHYGAATAQRLSGQFARLGITVVSGLARGIDMESHKAALKNKGRTIAVLGSGLNRVYPPENEALAEEIAGNGAVISEFPMDMGPLKENFPMRNRIISGLSLGVVVVEAAKSSGSLITADYALEQGREVFAVPGNADSVNSIGTNRLIKQGARLIESAEDVLQELAPRLKHHIRQIGADDKEAGFKSLSDQENALYRALSSRPLHIDELSQGSGMAPALCAHLLIKLQLASLVKELPGKYFVKAQL